MTPPRLRMPDSRWARIGLSVANIVIFLTIWETVAKHELINPLFFPAPSDTWAALREGFADGTLPEALAWSLRCFAIGMVAAAIVGIPIGLLMGSSPAAYTLLSPYVWSMASLPRVAITPLLILIFGFSQMAELVLIFLSALFPIVINCMAGPKTVDPSLLRAGRVFGASRLALYAKVVFPFTLPFIISGLNQGLTRGLVGMVIAEIFGGNNGLGYVIQRAGETFESPTLYAALLLLVVVSLSLVQLLRWLEIRVAPWRDQAARA
jgi:ABC-type nitrate/sulfonate/bicarbonate transport system permease component